MAVDGRDIQQLLNHGASALRDGDAKTAFFAFQKIVDAGQATAGAWLGLAVAHDRLNEEEAKLNALDQALKLDPGLLRALIMKGDHFADRGDDRAASSYYGSALKVASSMQGRVPEELMPLLRRAQDACTQYSEGYGAHLRASLAQSGFNAAALSNRFEQSLDLMLGEKSLYLQEPTTYYFPELPQIQFYDRDVFPWLTVLEAAIDDIRRELEVVSAHDGLFAPYVEAEDDRPVHDPHQMLGNSQWSSFYLWRDGDITEEARRYCPKTLRALESAPMPRIPGRSPTALFSLLEAHAHIPPHHGLVNTRLICHVPLVTPAGCRLRVGNETREYVSGEAWLFDDSIEHEAWNDSNERRVVLLFDVWRPELTEDERLLVSELFRAVDQYGAPSALE